MKRIYFNLRPGSRERMRDTIRAAKEKSEVVVSNVETNSSILLYKKNKADSINAFFKRKIIKYFKPINFQKINPLKNIDLYYLWGAFPKFTSKRNKSPFVIELDNPYVLTYYNVDSFYFRKKSIKENLNQTDKIVYLSEAAKFHTLELLGDDLENKSFVLYPYVERNYKKSEIKKNKEINFVFVGLHSKLKGAIELLHAFSNVSSNNIKLTFIGNIPNDVKIFFNHDSRIKFLAPQSRKILFEQIYPMMDIFIFPTLFDSFGMVLLEALSFGMGIITTNVYATSEMVLDQKNGSLLHHPILRPTVLAGRSTINCVDLTIHEFFRRYLCHNEFYYSLYSELKIAIENAIFNCPEWKKNSVEFFESKFSPEVWCNTYKQVMQ